MKLVKALPYALIAVVLGVLVWGVTHTQDVIDWYRLRDYVPSESVARLADNASFTEQGKKLFYVHYPDVLSREEFRGKCDVSEVTIVLGCYITHSKIYVFDVNESRLEGIEEVTAAHEMLHAAYDRLSNEERAQIDSLLRDVATAQSDERFKSTVDGYAKRDPSVVPNELHSIVGTEIRELPTELEEYYARYFINRLVVVEQAEAYAATFNALKDQIARLDEQLELLKASIDEKQVAIQQLNQALEVERQQLQAKRDDTEAYNAAVPAYNAKVRAYNSQLEQLRAEINKYNTLVEQRNEIAIEERELIQAIDSNTVEVE